MTTNEKVLIKVENLQKSFEDNKVLDGIIYAYVIVNCYTRNA